MAAARILLCAACALTLAGCDSLPGSGVDGGDAEARAGLAALFAESGRKPPLARVSLAGGDVVVAGPEGYCIDPTSKRTGPDSGFAVIASCHILSGGRAGDSVQPMLVTVAVGPRGDSTDLPTPEALALAAAVPVLTSRASADRVAVQLAQGGDEMFDGSDTRYWRGAFLQGDRLVGLALYAPKGSALAGKRGAAMLSRVKDSIARSTSGARPSRTAKKPGGLFGRLFNR